MNLWSMFKFKNVMGSDVTETLEVFLIVSNNIFKKIIVVILIN